MDAVSELGREGGVDQPMPVQPALPSKCLRDDIDTEMGLAARPVSRMPFMQMRLIDNPEAFRAESLRQSTRDQLVPGNTDLRRHTFTV